MAVIGKVFFMVVFERSRKIILSSELAGKLYLMNYDAAQYYCNFVTIFKLY